MDDQTLADLAVELGYDPTEFLDPYVSYAGVAPSYYEPEMQYSAQAYSDNTDDIESSPTPAQRGGNHQMLFSHHTPYQPPFDDEISQYEDDEARHPCTRVDYSNSTRAPANHDAFRQSTPARTPSARSTMAPQAIHAQFQPVRSGQKQSSTDRYNLQAGPHSEPNHAGGPHSYSEQESQHYSIQARGSNPRNSFDIRLRPVSDLPDIYRAMFKFGVFNAVQSTCFDTVLQSDENMVISAPTGSGKTVLFELSIIRMLTEASKTSQTKKCVYMAPTKALCSERFRDWSAKFDSLGAKCCELTGDTVDSGKGAWSDAKNATIIITTGEKWDSLTRNWRDHDQILSQIQLFLVDEVHILNEIRGSTLEVVISRMKTRGSAVRFVLVSATVPNIIDIANWIGASQPNGTPAKTFEFGEEFRPCKLTRFVYGMNRSKDQNDFAFASTLDRRLFSVLQQHSVNKPVLVFCATRAGCFTTAKVLAKAYQDALKNKQALPWQKPSKINQTFHDSKFAELAELGIGVHHAGVNIEDRRNIEDMFLNKILRIVLATSTLAVGVNLPAHTVVIKGVKVYQNNISAEYSDLDIMQMLGRAGRPQFDKEGVAIILCETELEVKYKTLVQGKTTLESCLHLNLLEHLNAEIGLGTILDVDTAKDWLYNSFMFQRIKKNPNHYLKSEGSRADFVRQDASAWQERVEDLVLKTVETLQESQLIEYDDKGRSKALRSTEYGDIMSKFYLRQATMQLILRLSDRPSLREILEMISSAEELADYRLRNGDKGVYTKLKQHDDIRFAVKKVEKTCDKNFLLIQAVLGGISLHEFKAPDSQPYSEALQVFRHVTRIARAVVEVGIVKQSGAQVKHGLEF